MSIKVQVSESLAEETQQFTWTIIFQELSMSKISFNDHQGEYSYISNASYELINIVKHCDMFPLFTMISLPQEIKEGNAG